MSMTSAAVSGAKPVHTIPPTMSLRALLDARSAEGRHLSLDEAIAVIVPVCLDLQERHARGEKLYVHPSCITPMADGLARLNTKLALVPTNPRDRQCLAPELQQTLEPGDACASVYSLGAILYEMVTGSQIGPAMRRPREVDPGLPEALEVLIGKAIIGERTHRPNDIGALASALYHVAPAKSIHPPEIEEARLDQSAELDVDVKFSMLPPMPSGAAQPAAPAPAPTSQQRIPRAAPPNFDATDPFHVIAPEPVPSARRIDDPVVRLAALKQRLESDPRPRYVVNKERMDHGPFTAVELLQQIASNTFTNEDILRDEISGQSKLIKEWEEFAAFSEQAQLKREVVAEKKAVARAERSEKRGGIAKVLIGTVLIAALGSGVTLWFLKHKGTRRDGEVSLLDDSYGGVDVNGHVQGGGAAARRGGPGGKGGRGAPGQPGYSGGTSFENVLDNNNETISMGAEQVPDLTQAQLAGPLRSAAFISGCGAPDDMKVVVRVAVKMGHAVGVTVSTNPPNGGVAACVDRHVRGLSWPANPKTDFVTTAY